MLQFRESEDHKKGMIERASIKTRLNRHTHRKLDLILTEKPAHVGLVHMAKVDQLFRDRLCRWFVKRSYARIFRGKLTFFLCVFSGAPIFWSPLQIPEITKRKDPGQQ